MRGFSSGIAAIYWLHACTSNVELFVQTFCCFNPNVTPQNLVVPVGLVVHLGI